MSQGKGGIEGGAGRSGVNELRGKQEFGWKAQPWDTGMGGGKLQQGKKYY